MPRSNSCWDTKSKTSTTLPCPMRNITHWHCCWLCLPPRISLKKLKQHCLLWRLGKRLIWRVPSSTKMTSIWSLSFLISLNSVKESLTTTSLSFKNMQRSLISTYLVNWSPTLARSIELESFKIRFRSRWKAARNSVRIRMYFSSKRGNRWLLRALAIKSHMHSMSESCIIKIKLWKSREI